VYDWDWHRAEREFHRAIELDDRLTSAYLWHALHLGCAHGRFDEAIAAATRATKIDPLSAVSFLALCSSYAVGGRFEAAEAAGRQGLELDPKLWPAEWFVAVALRGQGRGDEAIAMLEQVVSSSRRHHWPMMELTSALLNAGRKDDAIRIAAEVLDRARTGYVPPVVVSHMLAATGRTEEALEWLERAYRERDALPVWNYWPFDVVTNDARATAIFRRVGLEPNPRFLGATR
jgi:tetratricopeptide (TPR) repeat protein